MLRIIKGAVLLTSTYNDLSYYICPSPHKHGAIYFGKGLMSFLKNKEIKTNQRISDNTEYVIHNNGKMTIPVSLSEFVRYRDEISIYNFYSPNGIDTAIMSIAANHSCTYIGTPFSFFKHGNYCFELIINSYLYATSKNLYSPSVSYVDHDFYNSKAITHNYQFMIFFKKYKNKIRRYATTCTYKYP